VILIALCLLSVCTAGAQPYRQLTAADFEGTPRFNRGGAVAYTNCTIDFKYQAHRERGYYRLDFNVQLVMNRYKSWMDRSRITSEKMLAEVLRHEQGHYDIAYMEQQELIRALERTRFSANYQSEAQSLFNRIDNKYKQLNYDYDDDTSHMQNRNQQSSWDAFFRQKIKYLPEES
jgi:hypothetical protein